MASAGKLYHAPHELRLVTVLRGGARRNNAFRRQVPPARSSANPIKIKYLDHEQLGDAPKSPDL